MATSARKVSKKTGAMGSATCKTCRLCRQKKVKCDGRRPSCAECLAADVACVYPHDARREPRPSRARLQSLETTVAVLLDHMRANGVWPAHLEPPANLPADRNDGDHDSAEGLNHLASTAAIASPLPMPRNANQVGTNMINLSSTFSPPQKRPASPTSASSLGFNEQRQYRHPDPHYEQLDPYFQDQNEQSLQQPDGEELDGAEFRNRDGGHGPDPSIDGQTESAEMLQGRNDDGNRVDVDGADLVSHNASHAPDLDVDDQTESAELPQEENENGLNAKSMSSSEATVAGVFHEHGRVTTVHGLASIMNPPARGRHPEQSSSLEKREEIAIAASRARLISNAALQRQRESRIFRQPHNTMDFDGCDPVLAKHLIELHFNRQHYAYLISYRPAIMDNLANGGGPWLNKLLLNAIYYSSSLYSDRACLSTDGNDPQSIGRHFYKRFRHLLIDEIDRPSIPTAAALLLTSATLVSHGQTSAGWTLSGTAYRMLIDLGCHLTLGPDYQNPGTNVQSQGRILHSDIEQEMRRRLFWGAYVTDATQSLYLGRPAMFASVEARVPLKLLDTFEELEEWEPYIDPRGNNHIPSYSPQPAYANSTFTALARLFQISTKITSMYGIDVLKRTSEALREQKALIEKELDHWSDSLPTHLKYNPDSECLAPPPHQITPLTSFHAITIVLHRAFLESGHLQRHSDHDTKKRSEEACIKSALAIQSYVRLYRTAFTLRRAPFLLSYAIYSAVIVILRQERHERGQFTETISFFWTCLSELQRGCNFGLQKPLAILRTMVQEFELSANEHSGSEQGQRGLDESFFYPLPMTTQNGTGSTPCIYDSFTGQYMPQAYDTNDHFDFTSFDISPPGSMDFLNDQELSLSHDTLYGLFAQNQPYI